jgi:hypothetical protein
MILFCSHTKEAHNLGYMLSPWSQLAWVLILALSHISCDTLDKVFEPSMDDGDNAYFIGFCFED